MFSVSQKGAWTGPWLHESATVSPWLCKQGMYDRECYLPASWTTVSTTTASRKAQGEIKQSSQHSPPSAGFRTPHQYHSPALPQLSTHPSTASFPPSLLTIPFPGSPSDSYRHNSVGISLNLPKPSRPWPLPALCAEQLMLRRLEFHSSSPALSCELLLSPVQLSHSQGTQGRQSSHQGGGGRGNSVQTLCIFSVIIRHFSSAPLVHSPYRPLQQAWKIIFYLLL